MGTEISCLPICCDKFGHVFRSININKMNSARVLSRLMIGQTRAFRASGKQLAEGTDGAVHPRYFKFKENQKILAEIGAGLPIHEKRGTFAKSSYKFLRTMAFINVAGIL